VSSVAGRSKQAPGDKAGAASRRAQAGAALDRFLLDPNRRTFDELVDALAGAMPGARRGFQGRRALDFHVPRASADLDRLYRDLTGRRDDQRVPPPTPSPSHRAAARQSDEALAARGGGGTAGEASVDLTAELTVFLTTMGAPSYAECLEHLARQDCRFRFVTIDRVSPLTAALQRMIDACTTPYYVQVDEDMLLVPHAICTLHRCMQNAGPNAAIYVAPLFDEHLERCIHGVKIFRHAITKGYPYDLARYSPDDRVAALERDGYQVLSGEVQDCARTSVQTLGRHGTHWTPRAIYERYALLENWRRHELAGLDWFQVYPRIFLDCLLGDPSELNYFAFMGTVAGTLMWVHGQVMRKDALNREHPPGYGILRTMHATSPAPACGPPGPRAP
jgi:hypothetical protein